MEMVCFYSDWCIVRAEGSSRLWEIDFNDGAIIEVQEVHRIPAEKAKGFGELDLMDGADCPEHFDYSGEEDRTGDYCYWAYL